MMKVTKYKNGSAVIRCDGVEFSMLATMVEHAEQNGIMEEFNTAEMAAWDERTEKGPVLREG